MDSRGYSGMDYNGEFATFLSLFCQFVDTDHEMSQKPMTNSRIPCNL